MGTPLKEGNYKVLRFFCIMRPSPFRGKVPTGRMGVFCTLLSGLWHDGKNVKAFAEIFVPPLSKATRPARFFIGYLCCRSLSFNEFIPTSGQSLDFWLPFHQGKGKRPSAETSPIQHPHPTLKNFLI